MKKLKMTIEELRVTSFVTAAEDDQDGTVAAHGASGVTCVGCESLRNCPTILTRDCCTP